MLNKLPLTSFVDRIEAFLIGIGVAICVIIFVICINPLRAHLLNQEIIPCLASVAERVDVSKKFLTIIELYKFFLFSVVIKKVS